MASGSAENMYMYEPLQVGQIRLLEVSLSHDAPYGLHLILTNVYLNQGPRFAALSYTWDKTCESSTSGDGDVGPQHSDNVAVQEQVFAVRCGKGFLQVRENLFHFLQWLQTCRDPSTFWIDAICINQDDLDERSEQVVLMGDIYQRAGKVHIWLGREQISQGALGVIHEFIPAILGDWKLRTSGTEFYSKRDMLCYDKEIVDAIGVEACELWRSSWQDFIRIFERGWFSRGWIVQEVCIRDFHGCTFVAGMHEIDYKHLEEFDKFLVRTGWTQQLYRKTMDSKGFANARGAMASFSNLRDILSALAYSHEHNLQYLQAIYGAHTEQQAWYGAYLEVISRMRWRGLKDPRDIIYASLGMMTTVAPKDMPMRIDPDYRLTVEEVYTRFAALLVQEHPFISVLYVREDPSARRCKDLPSWVPDLSVGMSHNTLVRASDFYRDQAGQNYVFGRRFNASHTDLEDPGLREINGRILKLYGARLTTLSWCGPGDSLLTALSAAKFALQDNIHPCTHDLMYDAVWRTLIVDDPPPTLDRQTCPEIFRHWLLMQLAQLWRQCQEQSGTSAEHRLLLEEMKSSLGASQDCEEPSRRVPTLRSVVEASSDMDGLSNPDDKSFQVAYMVAMRGRRLYATSEGHIGLGPRSLRENDEVWLLKGVKVPLVLRKTPAGETYELIGESYIHGCMYGEAMTGDIRAQCGPVQII